MKSRFVAVAVAAMLPLPLFAQTQKITPPIALYWMSVETAGGMGMEIPPGMGGLMPQGMQGGKRMRLELGSSQQANGDARAAHAIPAGLAIGQSLPLVTPRIERAPRADHEEEPEDEHPKGRMLIYWGCGESVRPGQPVVIDFTSLNPQEAARVFRSHGISRPRGPAPGRNRTYGTWPNQEDSRPIPRTGSLLGEHLVSGNYSPEIRFEVDARYDFMDAVGFEPVRKTPAGAFAVKWKAVPTATGYFATAMGQGEDRNDIVTWSSSEVQEMGQVLMDYIPPAEVGRLIREKVVLAPQTTECTVPAGIFKGEGSMFNFIAYGNELNLVHPPRPQDPKQMWEQQWALKLRLKSTAMTLLAAGEGGARRGRTPAAQRGAEPPTTPSSQADAPPAPADKPQAPTPPDAVQEGVKTLRGILHF
jgi:hypothetical protein